MLAKFLLLFFFWGGGGGWGGLNLKGPYLSLKKEKENFCVVLTYSIKQAREISNFHIAVVQRRQRHAEKSMMHVQSYCFSNLYV